VKANSSRESLPPVYVVTLTWNQRADTLNCLESLSQITYPNYRLLLVDNASVDGTVEAVKERFPDVEVVVNPENLGFPGGFNVGLQRALDQGADYVFMINNDTFVEPNILSELVAHAVAPDVGMVAPKIYCADEPNRIWTIGGMRHPLTWEMTDIGDKQLDQGQWEDVVERDYLIGCALLIKRSLLEQVGLFDTGYCPIYYEDSDLSMRARHAGYRLLMVPSARMWHKGSASGGGNDSPRVRYLMARNSVRFFRKHVRGWRWLIVAPYRTGSAILWTLRLLRRGRFQSILAHWRGLFDGLMQRDAKVPLCSSS
jgi:GT2 family glycosyltransferase